MKTIKVALLGFGTVGSSVYQTLQSRQSKLERLIGRKVEIVGVLIQDETKQRDIADGILVTSSFEELINVCEIDVIIEAINGIEPGAGYLQSVLEKGIHVVTANKELLAHEGKSLRETADKGHAQLKYEAAVAGGVPIIGTLQQLLQVNHISNVEAILNGTSNYILTEIADNKVSFQEALHAAQELGYAEADPGNDVDGWDAFYKLMILSDLLLGNQPDWTQVTRRGIRSITLADIQAVETAGWKIKHIASLQVHEGKARLRVEPMAVSQGHPLYEVAGVDNAVSIDGDLAGNLKLQGPGAGALPTASAIVEDFVQLYKETDNRKAIMDTTFSAEDPSRLQDWLIMAPSIPKTAAVKQRWSGKQANSNTYLVSATAEELENLLQAGRISNYFRLAGAGREIQDTVPVLT
ncbi:homoserine dehydrogenase [Sediminibacillus dalangtanensis]|uniref:Homoserine dehydrogenase n=1 Tax=Sediminibacillus dalangtanensis TaxID=2729421 RepID=A0ABX7VX29_9BACI|nr:homoserine dehydrogenase [Sediminibacillus dalangtanensis]QTN00316.1 homoserine dehydrogenase [Sediminibacillus dalangtanensis]